MVKHIAFVPVPDKLDKSNGQRQDIRPFSRCGHLDFTPFQLIVTKLRLGDKLVWCRVCAMHVSFITVIVNREHDQYGDSAIEVYTG